MFEIKTTRNKNTKTHKYLKQIYQNTQNNISVNVSLCQRKQQMIIVAWPLLEIRNCFKIWSVSEAPDCGSFSLTFAAFACKYQDFVGLTDFLATSTSPHQSVTFANMLTQMNIRIYSYWKFDERISEYICITNLTRKNVRINIRIENWMNIRIFV